MATLFFILYILNKKELAFNKIELSNANVVMNHSGIQFMDTVVSVGLAELNISGVYVIVKKMSSDKVRNIINGETLHLNAYIIGGRNQYIIYINNLSRYTSIPVISHELIHLKQLRDNELTIFTNNYVKWKSDTLNSLDMKYNERPWEIEAHSLGNELSKKIKSVLL